MPMRLTEMAVEKLLPTEPGKRREVIDAATPGLMLRISGPRNKTWTALYRVAGEGGVGKRKEATRGTLKKMALGAWPQLSLKAARERAREVIEQADRGIDPAAAREEQAARRKASAFEVVFERFVELHVKQNTKEGRFARDRAAALERAKAGKGGPLRGPNSRLGRVAAERIIADNALPVWRDRLVETITRVEVHDLLDDVIVKRGNAMARELRKALTSLFNWAADRGHVPASPLAGMRRPELAYTPRERVLSMDELSRVWTAAGEAAYDEPVFGGKYREQVDPAKQKDVADVPISLIIAGVYVGDFDLSLSHKPAWAAGQGNYTTGLHWAGATNHIKHPGLIGRSLKLYEPATPQARFVIEIN